MSRYFSYKYQGLKPYVPGEQPKDKKFIKLNTNESPFPPSPKAIKYAAEAVGRANLYPDPEYKTLCKAFADDIGVKPAQVIPANGSDEILDMAFSAFCDDKTPAVFADITYGFYKVFAGKYNVPYEIIPLADDFTINTDDYVGINKTVFIASPNAPTGLLLSLAEIEKIVSTNPENVVVIDEAYIDFGGESAIKLIDKYKNLLVTRTFSKSRSMAGARLGFGVACEELIADLNALRFSTNPFNIDSMTVASGIGSIEDKEYFRENIDSIIKNRKYLEKELEALGFELTDSNTNFVFAKHPDITGAEMYKKLRDNGILVRFFDAPRTKEYVRITIGAAEEMQILAETLKKSRRSINEKL